MSNIEETLFAGRLENVIDDGGKVLGGALVKAEAPEVRTLAARIKRGVVLGVGVASGVHHPNIISFV